MCERDPDIADFLITKAIKFEKLGKSRTFTICNESEGRLQIVAYFTLAIQVFNIPEGYSGNKIKHLNGFGSKINGRFITEVPAILIGQIGKNDLHKDKIDGKQLMQFCMSTVLAGQATLGGRVVFLECKNIEYLVNTFYPTFGFKKLEKIYKPDEYIQFIRILEEDELIPRE